MYVVKYMMIMSQPAARSFSAAAAPSWGSEIKPTSTSSTSIFEIRAETIRADS
ncbi:unannotated protein [freshwater metagenome]|uniref:Unannotated protein n=1 Tax=freshwater metagenome TaxID=449393 RepID=A0A6J7VSZ3_9ZZZZ